MLKPVKIKFFNDKVEKEYAELSEDDPIKKRINWIIGRIKQSPSFGKPIAKRLIPPEYMREGITNAFWVELGAGKGGRLIYSLTSENKIEIVAIIIEWFTRHKDYERRFGYG